MDNVIQVNKGQYFKRFQDMLHMSCLNIDGFWEWSVYKFSISKPHFVRSICFGFSNSLSTKAIIDDFATCKIINEIIENEILYVYIYGKIIRNNITFCLLFYNIIHGNFSYI